MAGEEGKGDAAECSRKWARIYPPLDKGEGERERGRGGPYSCHDDI